MHIWYSLYMQHGCECMVKIDTVFGVDGGLGNMGRCPK